jgi:hypothetical protein
MQENEPMSIAESNYEMVEVTIARNQLRDVQDGSCLS